MKRYENAKGSLRAIDSQRLERSARREHVEAFIRMMKSNDGLITEFDEELWFATVESVTVHAGQEITFTFKDGMELDWNI